MSFISRERDSIFLKRYRTLDESKNYSILLSLMQNIPSQDEVTVVNKLPENIEAIIQSNLSLVCKENGKILYNVLNRLYGHYKDYNEGLSYISAFILCIVDEDQCYWVVRHIIDNIYQSNIWTQSSTELLTEIEVISHIVDTERPDVSLFMKNKGLKYNLFISEYLYKLFINVMERDDLLLFFIRLFTVDQPLMYIYGVIINTLIELCGSAETTVWNMLNKLSSISPSKYSIKCSADIPLHRLISRASVEFIASRNYDSDSDYDSE